MFLASEPLFHLIALRGEILLYELLFVLFCCAAILTAPARARAKVLTIVVPLYLLGVGGAIFIMIVSVLSLGEVGIFLTMPNLGPLVADLGKLGMLFGLPTVVVAVLLNILQRSRITAAGSSTFKDLVVSMIRGAILAVIILSLTIGGGILYVRSLPTISYEHLDLKESLIAASYSDEQMKGIMELQEFQNSFNTTFPYRFKPGETQYIFNSSEEFKAYDPAVWEATRRNWAFKFLGSLKFCTEHPFLSFVPSCIYSEPGEEKHLITL